MNVTPRVPAPQSAPLPPSFFDDARCTGGAPDRRAHHRRALLARCLQLASRRRWVAQWLFSDPRAAFHRNLPVALSAFDFAHPLSVMHSFHSHPHARQLASNMLLVPVAHIHPITVGYTISLGSNSKKHVGRYAFHSQSAEILMVINYYTFSDTVVMAIIPHLHTVKQFLLTCPSGEYSFENLPNQVLTAHTAQRRSTSSPSPSQRAFDKQTDPLSIDYYLQLQNPTEVSLPLCEPSDILSLLDIEPPSHLPWIIDGTSSLSDNIGIPASPGTADTSSGAFNLITLSNSIRHIDQSLNGTFLGTSENQCPLSLAVDSPVQKTVIRIATADSLEANLLRRIAVSIYFDSTIPVINDEKLLTIPVLLSSERPDVQQPPLQNAVPDLKGCPRRIAPNPIDCTSEGLPALKSEADLARERMQEARRRRNRLSAARSNEKRKQTWKRKVQTLEELKRRVEHLQSRRQLLTKENEMLRLQILQNEARSTSQ